MALRRCYAELCIELGTASAVNRNPVSLSHSRNRSTCINLMLIGKAKHFAGGLHKLTFRFNDFKLFFEHGCN